MTYDDSINFNKFLTEIKKVCNYEEGNKTIIKRFGPKKYIRSCKCRFCGTRTEICPYCNITLYEWNIGNFVCHDCGRHTYDEYREYVECEYCGTILCENCNEIICINKK